MGEVGRAVALIGHVYTDLSACRWGRWGGRWPSSVMFCRKSMTACFSSSVLRPPSKVKPRSLLSEKALINWNEEMLYT